MVLASTTCFEFQNPMGDITPALFILFIVIEGNSSFKKSSSSPCIITAISLNMKHSYLFVGRLPMTAASLHFREGFWVMADHCTRFIHDT